MIACGSPGIYRSKAAEAIPRTFHAGRRPSSPSLAFVGKVARRRVYSLQSRADRWRHLITVHRLSDLGPFPHRAAHGGTKRSFCSMPKPTATPDRSPASDGRPHCWELPPGHCQQRRVRTSQGTDTSDLQRASPNVRADWQLCERLLPVANCRPEPGSPLIRSSRSPQFDKR